MDNSEMKHDYEGLTVKPNLTPQSEDKKPTISIISIRTIAE